ncbi:MAG: tRNA 5-methylaminomethyl-2-thiouridine biosynthesis bifunctional protein MnmC [Microgenomates bacterium OLB22]|nr:MAG: tRNA 5-methylaminomethyl-2-thiouridine biosynthesis bifunctional protein MnmC [Microgenomates bacterium OLB22]
MHVAILGGGITGLTTALELAKKGYSVTLFERDSVFGGLAQGFIAPGWKWPLERAYHHLFFTDTDIRSFCRENDIEEPFFTEPRTDSLYTVNGISKIYPVDSPLDFLRFPLLSPITKLRGVCGLAFLILTPFLTVYQRLTAEQFVKRVMGQEMWNVFFRSLFRKKFGKYAGKILASFLWARIHKRTKKLGYFKGGISAVCQQHYLQNTS